MPDSLAQLEKQRTELFRQIAGLGDFRPGSVTTTSGKCGKPTCHCVRPNDPGHGPNFRLTRKVAGKTVTETFDSPVGLRKAQREVETFHRFQQLCAEIIALNERICGLRPVEQTLSPQEKKRQKQSSRKSRGK
jgi:predicted oxidoreductase